MIRFQPKPLPIPQATRCQINLAERMAEDIRELAFADQNVNAETLGYRGWTPALVKRIGPKATAIARRKSVRHAIEA